MIDAIGGQVPLAIGTVFLVNPHVKARQGQGARRHLREALATMPGVAPWPTRACPGSRRSPGGASSRRPAPAAPIVKSMHEEIAKALKVPAVAEKLTAQGMDIVGSSPEEAGPVPEGRDRALGQGRQGQQDQGGRLMRQYRIAVVPGDGIGKEVVPEGLRLLAAVEKKLGGFHCEPTHFPWGSDYYRAHGEMMPEDGNETLKPFSAILFGAVGDPELPDHLTLWGLRLKICQGFDQYANVRPDAHLPRRRRARSPAAGPATSTG